MSRSHALIDQALTLVEEGARDPLRAVKGGGQLRRVLHELRTEADRPPEVARGVTHGDHHRHHERGFDFPIAALGCTHIIRVTAIDPAGIAAGAETPTLKVEWPGGRGLVRSIYAGTTDGDVASLSSVSLRVTVNGTDDLFTDGEEPAFVPLVTFQAQNHNWFRLRDYEVTAQQRWTVQLRNEATGGGSIVPFVLFGYARTSNK
jgi:hypothetical protein